MLVESRYARGGQSAHRTTISTGAQQPQHPNRRGHRRDRVLVRSCPASSTPPRYGQVTLTLPLALALTLILLLPPAHTYAYPYRHGQFLAR